LALARIVRQSGAPFWGNPVKSKHLLSPLQVAIFLAFLLGLQPVLTDLFIPAMPAIRQEFSASALLVQATMFGVMIAFGFGQLFWGALSDRFGRRPILLWGLALFFSSGVVGGMSQQMEALLLTRVIQGAALGASVVCARAMVRDLYEVRDGAQVLARGLSGLGLFAIASPLFGGFLTEVFGWRANLFAIALVGLACCLMVLWFVPETLRHPNPKATHGLSLWRNYREILSHPEFLSWSLVAMSTYGGLFLILSGGPFIFLQVLEVSASAFGAVIAAGSSSYLLGTLACRRWIARYGLFGTVRLASWISILIVIIAVVLGILEIKSFFLTLCLQMLYGFAHGFHQPCSNAAAPGRFPEMAGTASSLMGMLMAFAAVATGLYLSISLDQGMRGYLWGIAFWGMLLVIAVRMVLPRMLPSEEKVQ
jgi:DHA1 family bicyclomycin/chloramphenicol resistance-like MFS transporter